MENSRYYRAGSRAEVPIHKRERGLKPNTSRSYGGEKEKQTVEEKRGLKTAPRRT